MGTKEFAASSMDQVFEKLGDLKHFFIYGQKLVPIIQKIIDFMRDTVPLLENVNFSIQYTTSKIPKASDQINNVTSATEMATSEILDLVDSIGTDITTIKTELASIKTGLENQQKGLALFKSENPALNGSFEKLESNLNVHSLNDKVKFLDKLVDKIHNDSTSIAIALQVQDITAQQLASVNYLIQSIQAKLSSLIGDLEAQGNREIPLLDAETELGDKHTSFNSNAIYDPSVEKQIRVDQIVDENKITSQAEIDKLFAK